MEATASLEAQPLEAEHPMLAPAQVTAQAIVESTVSWVEQCHQVNPGTGALSDVAKRWRAEVGQVPGRFPGALECPG
eukprot:12542249-Alexandrium_andersonii.AAC.1